jgi:hypothetical protein
MKMVLGLVSGLTLLGGGHVNMTSMGACIPPGILDCVKLTSNLNVLQSRGYEYVGSPPMGDAHPKCIVADGAIIGLVGQRYNGTDQGHNSLLVLAKK